MAGVLRAIQRAVGESLDAPEMSLFQPLVECLSPDALLAIGEPHLSAHATQGASV